VQDWVGRNQLFEFFSRNTLRNISTIAMPSKTQRAGVDVTSPSRRLFADL
jgi:hypothetical protein